MMRGIVRPMLALAITSQLCVPVFADWTLVPRGASTAVAKSKMKVTPADDWNRWSSRPSKGEIWTLDGLALNEVSFFAQIADGEPLYRERDRKNLPLPKFKADMLPTDLVELFEASNRILMQTSLFEMRNVEPAKMSGHDAVRFSYSYVMQGDELNRKGEAVAANIGGKLYLVNFVAPSMHYYDRDIAKFRALAASIRI